MKLNHIIYASNARPGLLRTDIDSILQVARRENELRNVTGMLVYTLGSFFQVLEGEPEVLEPLYNSIASDPRHNSATMIINERISDRIFEDWTMGFAEVTLAELNSIDGFNDFFRDGTSLTALKAGRAKKLLTAFAEGRWRNPVYRRAA